MNKTVYQIMSVIVAFALTFGSFTNAGASSANAPLAAATTYYVSTSGNDSSAGTSSAPFKTIQKCITAALAGDTCSVQTGTYNERFNVNKAITVVCLSARTCIIKGAILSSNSVVSGFYSLNSDTNDGGITGSGSGYKILNNKVDGSCMVGIKLSGSNGLAEGNEVLKSRQCSGSSGPDADGFRFFGSNHIMRSNYIHDISFGGSNVDPHIDCFQTWGGATNALMEKNICDNYFASTTGKEGSQGGNLEDCNGCTFKNNYFHVYGKGILFESSSSSSRADNNIFILGSKIQGATSGQYGLFGAMSANFNLFWKYPNASETLVAGASGTGNINNQDPQMNGYCSLAHPDKGVPCGVVAPTSTPIPATSTPIQPTKTPTIQATATLVQPTKTPTIQATSTLVQPTKTPTIQATSTLVQPTKTPTIQATSTLVQPTKTPTIQVTSTLVQPTKTPTIQATSTLVQPTKTSVPASATPSPIPASPIPVSPTPTMPQTTATTYYVSTTGNNANTGTSNAPFKTIQKCADVAGSGSVCSVAAGIYPERVNVTRAKIVFQGNGLVTMQGFTITADNTSVKGFYITGMASTLMGLTVSSKGCVIENNHVYYAPRGGISLASSSSGCVVKNNKLEKNSQWGLSVDGTNHTIDGNEIWGTIQYHPQWTNPPSWVDADGLRFFGTGHVIRNNYIHDIKFDSTYNPTAKITCFQTWTAATANILFEGNNCSEMYAGGNNAFAKGFMIEGGAHDITIRNNVINAYGAIDLGDPGDTAITKNIFILNNTIAGSISGQPGIEQYGVSVTKATAVTVKNNIVYNVLGTSFIGTMNASYNLLYRGDGKALSGSAVTGDLWNVDPLLTADYRLIPGSPAIGKADGGGDMGAFPFNGTPLPTVAVLATATLLNTPTITITPVITATSTAVSPTPTATLAAASFTPTLASSPTAATPTASSVPASATPVPASATPNVSAASATPTASSVAASATPVPVSATPTASALPVSATPTASSIPASVTPVPASATPIPSLVPASATPTASSLPASATPVPASATPIPSLVPASPTPTASVIPVVPTATSQIVPPTEDAPDDVNTLPPGTIYDDNDSSFVYSRGWKNVTRKSAYGGSFKETTKNGSSVTFTFTGQSFSVVYKGGQAFRKLDVYVDGLLVGTINEKGKSEFQKSWDYPGQLTLGTHTLKLVFVTGSNSDNTSGSLDAVIVR